MTCPALLSIVGKKGSGKSAVIETLIRILKERGLRVGLIKHMAKENLEIDQPGKDTWRYRQAGAETVILSGRNQLAVFSTITEETPLEKLLPGFQGFDLVIMEGYFLKEVKKIEIYQSESGEPLTRGMENVFTVDSG